MQTQLSLLPEPTMTLHEGDCLEVMKTMPDTSIDFVVCDPPYGLNFMGKKWDDTVPNIDIWKEALRICKPGSMLAAFGGSRTHHHLMIALEQAGWEIRDVMFWLYGSGFPKSLDVSKAIDKELGCERKEGYLDENFMKRNPNGKYFNIGIVGFKDKKYITKSFSDEAKQFDGYKSCLKPAYEPIILCMKPLDGTYAQNALKWGVAGLDVDASRIPTNDNWVRDRTNDPSDMGMWKGNKKILQESNLSGRYPSNVLLDESAAEMLDQQSGFSKSTKSKKNDNRYDCNAIDNTFSLKSNHCPENSHSDSGGASRFFKVFPDEECLRFKYCPKASPSERQGSTHPTMKPLALMRYLIKLLAPPGNPTCLDPFCGSGTTMLACKELAMDCIGIERESEYCEIIRKRLDIK